MRAKLFILSVVIVIALCAHGQTTTAQTAQATGWSEPEMLSVRGQRSWWPDVEADATGRVHVVWSSGYLGEEEVYDTVMYRSSRDDGPWSSPIDIMATNPFGTNMPVRAPAATRPEMAFDQQGNAFITYRDDENLWFSRVNVQDFGRPDTLERRAVSRTDVPYFATMAVDSKGVLHYFFTEAVHGVDCRLCYQLYYRRSADAGEIWSPIVSISDPSTGAAKPQVVVDKSDNIHVVWEVGEGGSLGQVGSLTGVVYAVSYDGGKTWEPPRKMAYEAVDIQGKSITIGVDGRGAVVVVWRSYPSNRVYFQVSTDQGRSWSAPQKLGQVLAPRPPYATNLDTYHMAADSAGNLHLVMTGRLASEQQSTNVLHFTWNGTSWSEPQVIFTADKDMLEWPRIAVSLGNQLNVVWTVRDELHAFDPDNGLYSVWYSRAVSDAPAVAPVVYPTPTPAPKPTATPSFAQVLPTPLPVNPAPSAVTRQALMTELDDTLLIGLSALPVLGLFVIVLVVFMRRR